MELMTPLMKHVPMRVMNCPFFVFCSSSCVQAFAHATPAAAEASFEAVLHFAYER